MRLSLLENYNDRIGAECPEIFVKLIFAVFFQILMILSWPAEAINFPLLENMVEATYPLWSLNLKGRASALKFQTKIYESVEPVTAYFISGDRSMLLISEF